MNTKFHISKFTNRKIIDNTLDAIDPDGEKMKKQKHIWKNKAMIHPNQVK